jgi:hypothetical protein
MIQQNGLSKPRGANPGPSSAEVIPATTSKRGWRLKGCSKCGGDLFQESGLGDWTRIACGWGGEVARGTLPDPPVPQLSSEEVSQ